MLPSPDGRTDNGAPVASLAANGQRGEAGSGCIELLRLACPCQSDEHAEKPRMTGAWGGRATHPVIPACPHSVTRRHPPVIPAVALPSFPRLPFCIPASHPSVIPAVFSGNPEEEPKTPGPLVTAPHPIALRTWKSPWIAVGTVRASCEILPFKAQGRCFAQNDRMGMTRGKRHGQATGGKEADPTGPFGWAGGCPGLSRRCLVTDHQPFSGSHGYTRSPASGILYRSHRYRTFHSCGGCRQ